jgi:hypothetical protein
MTKQQPCASRLRLSKICRWLIVLGIAKLALFGAWSVDIPLPQIFFPGKNTSSTPAPAKGQSDNQPPADGVAMTLPSVLQAGEVRLAALFSAPKAPAESKESAPGESVRKEPAAPKESAAVPFAESLPAASRLSPAQADAPPLADLRREAAIRSAAPLPSMPVIPLPGSKAARALQGAPIGDAGERPLASGVDAGADALPAVQEKAESNSWWSEIVALTRLPVPVLGVQQIAHAAASDMPPPTVRPATPGASPFAPPEQSKVPSVAPASGGQDGAPLPPRSHPNASQTGTGGAPAPTVKSAPSADTPDLKQQELVRREQDVLMLKQQMESRLQELQSAEKKVQGMIKEAHGVHDQKIRHLISAYTNMKPKQAAQALESLDERLAVRILAGMNPKQAGEVLTYANPKTVAKLSELLARMQLPGE